MSSVPPYTSPVPAPKGGGDRPPSSTSPNYQGARPAASTAAPAAGHPAVQPVAAPGPFLAAGYVDKIIGKLVEAKPYLADDLLDLRLFVAERQQPGRCVQAFFNIAESLADGHDDPQAPAVACLRYWLEAQLEVIARDSQGNDLEHLPAQLRGEDLEDYCGRVMQFFRSDRSYPDGLQLEFAFRNSSGSGGRSAHLAQAA